MTDEKFRRTGIIINILDVLCKVSGFIIGVLIGVNQFNRQQFANKKVEYRKAVWQKELEHYQKVCTATGKILAGSTPSHFDTSLYKQGLQEFLILYWGEGIFYANDTLKISLQDFREQITTFNFRKFIENDQESENNLDSMRTVGYLLIEAYGKSFNETEKKITNE